jgi:hypothetical protein
MRMSTATSSESAVAQAIASVASVFERTSAADGSLSATFGPQLKVNSPVWAASSRSDWEQQIAGLGQFFIEPKFEVLDVRIGNGPSAHVDWMITGTWGAPWRPRALMLGSSALELTTSSTSGAVQITNIVDNLHTSPIQVLCTQLIPNWEDVYNLYNTPPAETRPYRTLQKAAGYEVRMLPSALSIQADYSSAEYPSASSHILSAPVLPNCAFTGRSLSNKATWSAVRPLTVSCDQSAKAAGGPCRYRYTFPVPSRLGSDPAGLPSLASAKREAGVENLEYVRLPARRVAVSRSANTFDSDTAMLAEVEKLAAQLRADGFECVTGSDGRPTFHFSQYNTKIGFNLGGQVAIAQYQGTFGALRRNEIALEIVDRKSA